MKIAVAVIRSDDSILISRRLEGAHLAGLWEFPGGKIRPDENAEAAVRREVEEETGLRLLSLALLHRQEHEYPERRVELDFFLCCEFQGQASGREGQEVRWVPARELPAFPMPEANGPVVRLILEQLG